MAKAKTPKTPELPLDIPVTYGSVSFGKKTARVGVTVDRSLLTLKKADENLCDRRLTVKIHADGNGDQAGQGRLSGMEDSLDIVSVADVKGFGVHTGTISFGLTFNNAELRRIAVDTDVQFADFAAREGRLVISEVAQIPDDDDGDDEGSGEEGEE